MFPRMKLLRLFTFVFILGLVGLLLLNVFFTLKIYEQHVGGRSLKGEQAFVSTQHPEIDLRRFQFHRKSQTKEANGGFGRKDYEMHSINTLADAEITKTKPIPHHKRADLAVRKPYFEKPNMASSECTDLRIERKVPDNIEAENIACQPHLPSEEACAFAKEEYPFDPSLLECKERKTVKFCKFKERGGIKCVFPKTCQSLQVDGVDAMTGKYETKGYFSSAEAIERELANILSRTTMEGFNFVFIACLLRNGSLDVPQQLFSWASPSRKTTSSASAINVNIVLLDSISRPHFYRSLPRVVDEFDRVNSDSKSGGEILDFSLFQSIHGHSAENAHALFAGKVFPKNITDTERERSAVGIGDLFNLFRTAGYRTMYQDDLCWSVLWGLRMELGGPKNWKELKKEMERAGIDNSGLSVASCRILESLGLDIPFTKSKNNQICFNGQFQHDYLLNYAWLWHRYSGTPTISYTSLNVAHDTRGIRTQTLNNELIEHVRKALRLDKTITVLLADHGNTYTPYIRKILEGRFEMYHPSFFMVIPDGVRIELGEQTMNLLRANQNRLLTMLDLNAGLRAIREFAVNAELPEKNGIFGLIPAERTCNDLPLVLPNLCVCEGWDNAVKNDSSVLSVLEYGVGFLNKEIDRQWHIKREANLRAGFSAHSNKNHPQYRSCHHLVPIMFKNVRHRNSDETLITSYDVVFSAGSGVEHKEDIFHLEVQSSVRPDVKENYMKVSSFERLSPYAPYKKCADQGVNLRLCVCSYATNGVDKSTYSGPKTIRNLWNYIPMLPGINSRKTLFNRKKDRCIYIVTRDYFAVEADGKTDAKKIWTAVVEALNICPAESFVVKIDIDAVRMKVADQFSFSAVVKENTLRLLSVLETENLTWPTSYKIHYDVLPL